MRHASNNYAPSTILFYGLENPYPRGGLRGKNLEVLQMGVDRLLVQPREDSPDRVLYHKICRRDWPDLLCVNSVLTKTTVAEAGALEVLRVLRWALRFIPLS